jgi:8-oxo-dGTP diphosphatase
MEPWLAPETVVRALVVDEGDGVLLVRRSAGDRLAHHWELPGGGLGDDETVGEALARELAEETGLEPCGPPALVGSADRVTPSGRSITEYAFAVGATGDVRLSAEHDAARWVRPGEEPPALLTEAARDALSRLD